MSFFRFVMLFCVSICFNMNAGSEIVEFVYGLAAQSAGRSIASAATNYTLPATAIDACSVYATNRDLCADVIVKIPVALTVWYSLYLFYVKMAGMASATPRRKELFELSYYSGRQLAFFLAFTQDFKNVYKNANADKPTSMQWFTAALVGLVAGYLSLEMGDALADRAVPSARSRFVNTLLSYIVSAAMAFNIRDYFFQSDLDACKTCVDMHTVGDDVAYTARDITPKFVELLRKL